MEEKFKCPRCGFEQPPTDDCRKCRVNIPKYIEIQKRRVIKPGKAAQEPREEKPSWEIREFSPGDEQTSEEKEEPTQKIAPVIPSEKLTVTGLSNIGELFGRTWDIFKSRVGTLIVLYFLSIVFMAVPLGIFLGAGYMISILYPDTKVISLAGGGILGMTIGMIGMFWGMAAFLFAVVNKDLRITDALEKGWQKCWSFIWLSMVVGFIITGGFLLLLIPGIIFLVWFSLAQFVFANEDERGLNAIIKSKEYVRGYFLDVFVRLLLLWIISAVIGIIPLIGPVLAVLFVPFTMIFIYLIYSDLREIKGDISPSPSTGEKFKWVGISALGYIAVPVIVVAFMGTSLIAPLILLKGMMKSHDQKIIIMPQPESPSIPIPQAPESISPPQQDVMMPEGEDVSHDVMIYIYSLNYKGKVRLNGEDLYEIKGEKDMNYNYSTGGKLRYGRNIFDVQYTPLSDPRMKEIKIRVYKYDWDTRKEEVLKEWIVNDLGGSRSFEVIIGK
ncbi:MAG: hypothetical protein AB1480_02525 [Nitrospirota bacterium]